MNVFIECDIAISVIDLNQNKVTSGVIIHDCIFASLSLDMAALSVNEFDSVSSVCDHDRHAFDPLPPLPKIDSNLSRLHSPVYLPSPTTAANFSMSPSAPYNFVPDASTYISMPGANGAASIVSSSGMTAICLNSAFK